MPANRMTPGECREHFARLGLTQNGAARLFRITPTTVRRWVSLTDAEAGDIPRAVEIALLLLTPSRLKALLAVEADVVPKGTKTEASAERVKGRARRQRKGQ